MSEKKSTKQSSSSSRHNDETLQVAEVNHEGDVKRYPTRRASQLANEALQHGSMMIMDSKNDDEDYLDDEANSTSGDSFDDEEIPDGDDESDSDSEQHRGRQSTSFKRSQISKSARQVLMTWLEEHFGHPYPDDNQKIELMEKTGLTLNQINIWFVNSRMRVWKPRFDQQQQSAKNQSSSSSLDQSSSTIGLLNQSSTTTNTNNEQSTLQLNSVATVNSSGGAKSNHHQIEKKQPTTSDTLYGEDLKNSLSTRINPNNANVTRTNIVGSLPNGLPTPSTVICRGNLPKEAVDSLLKWLFDFFSHPYPSDEEKDVLAVETNLTLTQVNNWFINARRRIWKPILQKIKSNGMDKDELLSQGKLAEVAKSFYKEQKLSEEEPATKKRSKSSNSKSASNSDHEEVVTTAAKKHKRGESSSTITTQQQQQPVSNSSFHHSDPGVGSSIPPLSVREPVSVRKVKHHHLNSNNKSTHRELFVEQYRLSMENQKIEEDIHQVHQRYALLLEDISEKNVKLLSHITLLEQKQQQVQLNNELLRKEVDVLKVSSSFTTAGNDGNRVTMVMNSNQFNAGNFLIENLGTSM